MKNKSFSIKKSLLCSSNPKIYQCISMQSNKKNLKLNMLYDEEVSIKNQIEDSINEEFIDEEKELDDKLARLNREVDNKIQKALDNPLAK